MAYEVTTSLSMEIVYRTLKKLAEALDGNVHPEAMIHSDQGFHYTHPVIAILLLSNKVKALTTEFLTSDHYYKKDQKEKRREKAANREGYES